MLKVIGLTWLGALAFYGLLTITENSPELAAGFIITAIPLAIALLVKWSR